MPHRFEKIEALEILDSRGKPTLQVSVRLQSGASGVAGVPSGASTGRREAVERRDGDPARYRGLGVQLAAAAVGGEIAERLCGPEWSSLADIDRALIDLDGSANKARLGANALVGVSMAAARALAQADGIVLWRWLAPTTVQPLLPVPHFNVINGGAHAANPLEFQEFMVAPVGAPSFREALRAGAEVYASLRAALTDAGMSTGLGDEGGFAPQLTTPEEVLELLVSAIDSAGYHRGERGVAIALDPAASGFQGVDGSYTVAGERLSADDMIERYVELVSRFPIRLIEDGLGEDDWSGWARLTERLGDQIQLVGDDIFVTDPATIADAIDRGIANAALIKLNQIGTVTETLEAMGVCRRGGFGQFVSHRSGETIDSFIADLTVGSGCGQLKSGAPARGERVAKYNRLVEIEAANAEMAYGLSIDRVAPGDSNPSLL